MLIGPKELLKLVKKVKLVENLSDRELNNPEGAGFDIRLGKLYKLGKGKAFLGVVDRMTPDVAEVKPLSKGESKYFVIKPGEYFLAETIEKVNLPKDIAAHPFSRSTLQRSGVLFIATQIAPGYSGGLVFALKNEGQTDVEIEVGARFAHLQFEYVAGGGSKYRGQWQGGRVAAVKKEKQV